MFFEKDYDLLPRTYSVKSYRRKESKLLKRLASLSMFLLILSIAVFVFILFVVK
ncbi:hypothetical protein [Acetivibrio cellulolyticus]|uniref:hypothetical protein n=1 Tax=Acetivibrio cellulolyticus TaxID=35830 RepID=UPI0001E30122|nr:hypothetical protein [Acetivibrio cellulolyticus]